METAVPRRVSLQMKMLIGFLIGLAAGLAVNMTNPDAPWVEAVITYVTGPIGQIFLRLLFMLVIPLALLGPGHRHRRDGRRPLAEADRRQDPVLHRSASRRSPW